MYFKDDQDRDWTPYKAESKLKLKGVCFAQEMAQKLHMAHKRSSVSIADEILYRESMRSAQKKHEAKSSMMTRIAMRVLIARNLIGFDKYGALSDGRVLVGATIEPVFGQDGGVLEQGSVQLACIGNNDALDATFDLSKVPGDLGQLCVFKPIGINVIHTTTDVFDSSKQIVLDAIRPSVARFISDGHQDITFYHRIHIREWDITHIFDCEDRPSVQPLVSYDPKIKCQTLKDAMAKMYITNQNDGNNVKIDRIQKEAIAMRCDFPDYFS